MRRKRTLVLSSTEVFATRKKTARFPTFNGFYRGYDPSAWADMELTTINAPVRIVRVVVLPVISFWPNRKAFCSSPLSLPRMRSVRPSSPHLPMSTTSSSIARARMARNLKEGGRRRNMTPLQNGSMPIPKSSRCQGASSTRSWPKRSNGRKIDVSAYVIESQQLRQMLHALTRLFPQ